MSVPCLGSYDAHLHFGILCGSRIDADRTGAVVDHIDRCTVDGDTAVLDIELGIVVGITAHEIGCLPVRLVEIDAAE